MTPTLSTSAIYTTEKGEERAALVTKVYQDQSVDLHVFPEGLGDSYGVQAVAYSSEALPKTWRYAE